MAHNWIDEAAAGFDAAKNWLVDNVANVIPYCNNDICKSALHAGLDAGLAALGLPPSLPNFEALQADGENYVAAAILDEVGLDCTDPNDPCSSLVQMAHDQAQDQLAQGIHQALFQTALSEQNSTCMSEEDAHALGFDPVCIPASFLLSIHTIPHPESGGRPAQVTLDISRDPNVPDSALPRTYSCSFTLRSPAKNNSWLFKKVALGNVGQVIWNGSDITTDALYNDVSSHIPRQITGVMHLPLELTRNSSTFPHTDTGFWIPAHAEDDSSSELLLGWDPSVEDPTGDPDDWMVMYRGGQVTFNVTESCTAPGSTLFGGFIDQPVASQTMENPK